MAARLTAYLVATIVAATFIAGLMVRAQREDDGAVDLIVVNGHVYAGDGADELAEAVAIRGNKVVRVGTTREIQRLRRAQTTVVDANGGAVVPGFNDAHAHLISGGLGLDQVDLTDAEEIDAVRATIQVWAEAHPDRAWITGRGWYYSSFPGGLPTRQLLDTLVPDRPAYLVAYDGHTAWANTAALKAAGVTRRTPNPAGGFVMKDARGEPTGILKESAMALVADKAPQPTREDKLAALRAAIEEAHRYGVTSATSARGVPDDLELYNTLREHGDLTLRVYQALTADATLTEAGLAPYTQARARFGDDPLLKTGAVKLFADGVVETFTAALLQPYATRPSTTGEPRFTQAEINRVVTLLDKNGWQVMTHAIGDAAVRMALDAYEAAAAANPAPPRGRRHRIEHIETVDPADIPRFGALGVVASMEPFHASPEVVPGVWSTNLGPERAARGWLWTSISKAGGRVAFGSDWPVVTIDPRPGIHVATTRTNLKGLPEGGSNPDERFTLREAIDAYTRTAAWAAFDEQRKGVLERDMLADIVVFDRNLFATPAPRIMDANVAVTIFDGKVVYRRDPAAPTEP